MQKENEQPTPESSRRKRKERGNPEEEEEEAAPRLQDNIRSPLQTPGAVLRWRSGESLQKGWYEGGGNKLLDFPDQFE